MIQCPNCGKEKAILHPILGVLPGKRCQAANRRLPLHRPPAFATQRQTDRVQQGRDAHAKDVLQPWVGKDMKPNKEFTDAYPDKAEDYFDRGQLEKL